MFIVPLHGLFFFIYITCCINLTIVLSERGFCLLENLNLKYLR